jgi:hypothetical protein
MSCGARPKQQARYQDRSCCPQRAGKEPQEGAVGAHLNLPEGCHFRYTSYDKKESHPSLALIHPPEK